MLEMKICLHLQLQLTNKMKKAFLGGVTQTHNLFFTKLITSSQ